MKIHTLFLSELPAENRRFTLPEEEAAHLFRVFRAAVGDEVEILDGTGRRGYARVLKDKVLEMTRVEIAPPPGKEFHLYCALPRRNKQDDLFRQAAESGVTMIHPVHFSRSVERNEATPRWEMLLREACKQSKNPFLPELGASLSLDEALDDAARRSLAVCFGSVEKVPCPVLPDARGGAWFVGPEGGFTGEEVERMRSRGGIGINLGPYVMRLETAAVAGIAVLRKLLCLALMLVFFAGCGRQDVSRKALMVKGKHYRDTGDAELAEKFFRRAIHKYPDAPEPLLAMASLCDEELDRPIAALYFYEEYLDAVPGDHPDREMIVRCRDRIRASLEKSADPEEVRKLKAEIVSLRRIVIRQRSEIYGLREAAEKQAAENAAARERMATHTVRSGDTLSQIAARHGISVDALLRENRLAPDAVLHVGDVLVLPKR
ncbi:MAG: RsmE family RNA methyltransferase [Victivallaceae bacterium]|nr:RsmE family RNA methyltransferase [Victivallaceae bacterium]